MVQRWLVVAVLSFSAAACDSGKPATSSGSATPTRNDLPCDPSKPITVEWALALYVVETKDTRYVVGKVSLRDRGDGVVELIDEPPITTGEGRMGRRNEFGPVAARVLGKYIECARYVDEDGIVSVLLRRRGWATADPAKRVEMVTGFEEQISPSTLTQPPTHWDDAAKTAFAPPKFEVTPDGGVKITRWASQIVPGSVKPRGPQGPKYYYVRESQTVDANGTVLPPNELERRD